MGAMSFAHTLRPHRQQHHHHHRLHHQHHQHHQHDDRHDDCHDHQFLGPRPTLPPTLLGVLTMLVGTGTMALVYALLSLAPCLVSGVCYKGYESDYSFDANTAHNPSWMGSMPDDVNITSLSIPGTHDTMTYNINKFHLQCQNWDLTAQLNAGLRYVDIRARLQNNELHVFHGREPTGYSYKDVLLGLFAFLDANPSEAIIMRLKREGGPLGRGNKRTFQEAFNYARLHDPATRPGAAKHLFLYNDTSLPIPTLGQLRSKVFILQNWKAEDSDTAAAAAAAAPKHGPDKQVDHVSYGLEWDGPQMVLEDKWIIPSPSHLDQKWDAIRSALEKANAAPLDNKYLYLSHISASVGVLPIEAAAGTKNDIYPLGMNDRTGAWAEEHLRAGVRMGVVMFDFPGQRAIDAVLEWNHHLGKR
ncbi:hypothetical protein E4U43_004035 [Claviceps pusilla]|uniref:Phosphatidylinositol-specific phospholipase C X domain-containing protein n=1 Tax=Claviceps pusilla TaxID=123648 RepID=A0A9P7N4R4_9HYPO|nr:hypothetical protein E4U43_004035 [Claviceps pusilla]